MTQKEIVEKAQRRKCGEPGLRIPGSCFVRDYCAVCGEPIRVLGVEEENICYSCTHKPPAPPGHGEAYIDHGDSPAWHNMIRMLEGD